MTMTFDPTGFIFTLIDSDNGEFRWDDLDHHLVMGGGYLWSTQNKVSKSISQNPPPMLQGGLLGRIVETVFDEIPNGWWPPHPGRSNSNIKIILRTQDAVLVEVGNGAQEIVIIMVE